MILPNGAAFLGLHQGIHAQDGVALLSEEAHQGLGILGDGFVADHVAELGPSGPWASRQYALSRPRPS